MLPARPELSESDTESEISNWDSKGEAGLNEAAKLLNDLCDNHEQRNEPTSDPTPVAGQLEAKVEISRVRAQSATRVNKAIIEPTPDNTVQSSTSDRRSWLSITTLPNIEKALVRGRCAICNFQANKLRRTKLHIRQHYTLHICPCKLFSPLRDTIYRHQRQGRCALHHSEICKVDRELYAQLCKHVGWMDPPKLGKCVPTQQRTKEDNNQGEKSTTPIRILKLRAG